MEKDVISEADDTIVIDVPEQKEYVISIANNRYDVGVKTINKFNPIPYSTLKNSYFVVYRRGLGNI